MKVINLQEYGNLIAVLYDDGTKAFAYPTTGGLWIVNGTEQTPPIEFPIIDNILPGHSITNPGGTIVTAWNWHLANNSNRGGVDLNYNFQDFVAPGSGTVSHFDIAGVGMVVKLVLDEPVPRKMPQLGYDQYGPMTAIWFQHCSAAVDGHAEQGDVIGTSGNGYGDYGAHLHVHGMINNTNSAPASARCNFWGFV